MATPFLGTKDLGEKDKERGEGRDGQREEGKKRGREREEDIDDKRGRTRGGRKKRVQRGTVIRSPLTAPMVSQKNRLKAPPPAPALRPHFIVKL